MLVHIIHRGYHQTASTTCCVRRWHSVDDLMTPCCAYRDVQKTSTSGVSHVCCYLMPATLKLSGLDCKSCIRQTAQSKLTRPQFNHQVSSVTLVFTWKGSTAGDAANCEVVGDMLLPFLMPPAGPSANSLFLSRTDSCNSSLSAPCNGVERYLWAGSKRACYIPLYFNSCIQLSKLCCIMHSVHYRNCPVLSKPVQQSTTSQLQQRQWSSR